MNHPFIVIGGGLSGLAAAIRLARYTPNVLLLEQHNRVGGLNSYYRRHGQLFETGLHAFTNYADAGVKQAPLNLLFRQLQLPRRDFITLPQHRSIIRFSGHPDLYFTNTFSDLEAQVAQYYPCSADGFRQLVRLIREADPFNASHQTVSARKILADHLVDPLLVEMLLCPLLYYGSAFEHDMDLGQFIIMFRSLYLEGLFRPKGTIKDFLDMLVSHFTELGGSLRLSATVRKIHHTGSRVQAVELTTGERIDCHQILSTIGADETKSLLADHQNQVLETEKARLGFIENIYLFPKTETTANCPALAGETTILFYSTGTQLNYRRPSTPVDYSSGVICFPSQFVGREAFPHIEMRTTHLANAHYWLNLAKHNTTAYKANKEAAAEQSLRAVEQIIGSCPEHVFQDTFTPATLERYTGKREGAIYGSPHKVPDGTTSFDNLFLAGTDQGFVGIIGAMLSGVAIVNRHLLSKI